MVLEYFDPINIGCMVQMNDLWGDLTSVSAETKTLVDIADVLKGCITMNRAGNVTVHI